MPKQWWTTAALLGCVACSNSHSSQLVNGCSPGCPTGQACVQNACVSLCVAGGGTSCDSACVDLQSDQANCGSCGNACQAGLVCLNGSCAAGCGPGLTLCNGTGGLAFCAALLDDPTNCGECGKNCAAGTSCLDGGCVEPSTICPANEQLCQSPDGGTVCSDTQSDSANCGGCGRACAAGDDCYQGSCVITCSAGLSHCPSGCVDLTMDGNCGACGISCGDNAFCSDGVCSCAAGYSQCGDANTPSCAQLPSDPSNCGSCGHRCVACETCIAGVCTTEAGILTTVPFALPGGANAAFGVAIADFNRDGIQDIAVTFSSADAGVVAAADELAIFFGDGGGGFPTSLIMTFADIGDLAAGDFNGDGLTDLAVVVGTNGSGFFVLYGEADGGLLTSPTYAAARDLATIGDSIRAADYNDDGLTDVALLTEFGVYIFFATADGGFTTPSARLAPADFETSSIASGDFDGDGLADLAVVVDDTLYPFVQDSSGLQAAGSFYIGANATPVIGTGIVDAIGGPFTTIVEWLDGGFSMPTGFSIDAIDGVAVDLNEDGISDLIAGGDNSSVWVFLGRSGAEHYGSPILLDVGLSSSRDAYAVGDLNGDGRPDVAEANSFGVVLLFDQCRATP